MFVLLSGPPTTLAAARLSHTGPSWADRVKCTQAVPNSSQPTTCTVEKLGMKCPPTTPTQGLEEYNNTSSP